MCPTSQVLAIINNPNICKTEEALLHWEWLHYSETLNIEDKLGHSSSEILFSQAALLPRKLLQLPTESLDTNAHSCRGRTKDFTFITIWELLGGAVGRKLLPSKKPRLLQESRTGVSVCPLSCCHQGPGNPDRNPMCFVKVKGRLKLCTEGYAEAACAGCACLLIFQTVHQIHKLPIKYTREMGGGEHGLRLVLSLFS